MNSWLDKVYFRWTITKESSETRSYEMSLREYVEKHKKDILIGISFKESKWSKPELIIK